MELIHNISELSVLSELPSWGETGVQHVQLAGPQSFARPKPLLMLLGGAEWEWLAAYHNNPEMPTPCAVNCYFIRDLTVVGHDACIVANKLAIGPDMIPTYRARQLLDGPHTKLFESQLHLPHSEITEPCFPLAADGRVYGHFLIEALARLHVIRRFLHPLLPTYKVLIVKDLPTWTRNILSNVYGLHEKDILEYDPTKEKVRIREAIWPSLTVNRNCFHEYTNSIVSDILCDPLFAGGLDIHRLMVSRAWFFNPIMQHATFANEHELTEIAVREYGFCPMSPETLSWTDQVRLFANARVVVGRFGSGLHNTLFCRRGTVVGVLGFRNLVQSGIAALRSHDMAYITEGNDNDPFTVSAAKFRKMLDTLTAAR